MYTADPLFCNGKPAITGTRIMVWNILGMMDGGYSMSKILDTYRELTPEDVQATLEYALK